MAKNWPFTSTSLITGGDRQHADPGIAGLSRRIPPRPLATYHHNNRECNGPDATGMLRNYPLNRQLNFQIMLPNDAIIQP